MPAPIVGTWAQNLYDRLGPIKDQDAALNWPLLTYVGALGDKLMQDINDLVVDQPDGTPGWAILLSPATCPLYALPWLGQLVGVSVDTSLAEVFQRNQIANVGGWYRGSPNSMVNASKPFLSGTKFVQLVERYGGNAYELLYITHTSETPTDPTAMRAAVVAQKPAGINITFASYVGATWADIKAGYATWQAVKNNFAFWNDVKIS